MARIRSLKPDFFRSRSLARVPMAARLTFQGLWCEADDHGRGIADARLLKGSVWPLEDQVAAADVAVHLADLAQTGHIRLYEVDDEVYYEICSWEQHQAAAYRRGDPLHPPPSAQTVSGGSLHDESCRNVQGSAPPTLDPAGGEQGDGEGGGEGVGVLAPVKPSQAVAVAVERHPAKTSRAPDLLFEAVCEACSIDWRSLTNGGRGPVNRAVGDLRQVGAQPEQVHQRALAYRVVYPDVALTPTALSKHWASIEGEALKVVENPGRERLRAVRADVQTQRNRDEANRLFEERRARRTGA